MKRIVSMLVALTLVLSAVCCAAAEKADDNTFSTPYFTLTLPDGWVYDTEDAETEMTDNEQYLGLFGSFGDRGFVVDSYLMYLEELKDISLWNLEEAELQDYADIIMSVLEEDNPEYLGVVTAGSIPFILIRATDEEGEYLYADTVANGHSIQFEAFLMGEDSYTLLDFTDQEIEEFKSILETFLPVT